MGLTSFLRVNGVDFPCPAVGFNYIISTTVDSGRNANNQIVGQKIGRDLYKLNSLEWNALDADVWQMMLAAVEPFFVPVTFEDYRTGEPITVTMYPGDRTAEPLFVDPVTHKVTKYRNCKFNLIDCGWD
ncbi:MAG: hypothetical protein J6Q48_10535 [Bacteroidaceae bacterium]|nr:hypothetical protein [Bacteroidaceae bacterium]